jgi:hypothetical protein
MSAGTPEPSGLTKEQQQLCDDLDRCADILDGKPTGWQPIATAPQDEEVFFWVVPKTAEESYTDTSGKPIVGRFEPYMLLCKWKQWSALSKAILWHRKPDPPVAAVRAAEGREP